MNKTSGISFETVLEHLALDGIIKRLQELDVPSDALTWLRFFGALLLVLLVLLFLSDEKLQFCFGRV